MRRLVLLLLAPFLLVLPTSAAAESGTERVIHYRIAEAPIFTDGPEGVCMFSGTGAIETLNGAPYGSTTLCVEEVDERFGPPYRFIEHGQLTVRLAGGELRFNVTFTDTYNPDQTAAAHNACGTMIGGTGRFQNATGTLRGSGVILFHPDGTFTPFLTYHVQL